MPYHPKSDLEESEELLIRVKSALANAVMSSDISEISVDVKRSVVSLAGNIDSDGDKAIATAIVQNVPGVKGIVQHLKVGMSPERARAYEIREKIWALLKQNLEIPHGQIKISIGVPRIMLQGTVRWNYQKEAILEHARSAAEEVAIADLILVDPNFSDVLTKETILDAIRRDARVGCDDLSAIINGRNVILVGSVPTESQKYLLEKIVSEIGGVASVRNAVLVR